MIVDVHNHYYPPEYVEALRSSSSVLTVTTDDEGNPVIHYPGDYNVLVPGHRDLAHRLEVLDEQGVGTQVLTLTTPGTHVESPALAARLASVVNDAFARAVADYPGRFSALATLPLNDPAASAAELERAMGALGLPGAMLFSNVNGTGLDSEGFWPMYERANEHGAVLMIHPTHPVGVEAMLDYWLMPLLGFPFDTSLAAAKIVFSGVAQRFPRIKWLLAHLGGTIPYVAERLDRGYRAFRECRAHIERPPSDYLKGFYFDTVNFDPNALQLAIEFAGAGHVVAGSDYPHMIGSIPQMLSALRSLPVEEDVRTRLLGDNARLLFGLS